MFKKVLLAASPTEASERAADMAFALAKQSKAIVAPAESRTGQKHMYRVCGRCCCPLCDYRGPAYETKQGQEIHPRNKLTQHVRRASQFIRD